MASISSGVAPASRNLFSSSSNRVKLMPSSATIWAIRVHGTPPWAKDPKIPCPSYLIGYYWGASAVPEKWEMTLFDLAWSGDATTPPEQRLPKFRVEPLVEQLHFLDLGQRNGLQAVLGHHVDVLDLDVLVFANRLPLLLDAENGARQGRRPLD